MVGRKEGKVKKKGAEKTATQGRQKREGRMIQKKETRKKGVK